MDSRDPAGDSPTTASDQRRGWGRRHPVVTGFLVLIVLLVAGVWIAHDQAERALARRIAAIRERGEPTTVQDMLSSQPRIPDNENMAIQLASAGRAAFSVKTNEIESKSIPYLRSAWLPPTGERWSDAMFSASEAYLARPGDALSGAHEALKLQRSYITVNWETPVSGGPSRELVGLRQAVHLLLLECQIEAQKGRREQVERCLFEMAPLARPLERCDTLMDASVQISITASIQDGVERCINQCGLSDASLRKLQVVLQETERYPDMKQALRGERVILLDRFQWVRSSGEPTVIVMTANGCERHHDPWTYLTVIPPLDIAALLDQFENFINIVSEPDSTFVQETTSLDEHVQRIPKYCVMSRGLLPSVWYAVVRWVRNNGTNRALRAAIGAERFRLATARWPEKLDDLVPDYLDAVPIDPIDGKPIRYAIIPEGIKTWTICGDDNIQDDGGDVRRLALWDPYGFRNRPKDYGWVILNPAMRNRPAQTTSQPTTKPSENSQ